jgi:hypothetical protein
MKTNFNVALGVIPLIEVVRKNVKCMIFKAKQKHRPLFYSRSCWRKKETDVLSLAYRQHRRPIFVMNSTDFPEKQPPQKGRVVLYLPERECPTWCQNLSNRRRHKETTSINQLKPGETTGLRCIWRSEK